MAVVHQRWTRMQTMKGSGAASDGVIQTETW